MTEENGEDYSASQLRHNSGRKNDVDNRQRFPKSSEDVQSE